MNLMNVISFELFWAPCACRVAMMSHVATSDGEMSCMTAAEADEGDITAEAEGDWRPATFLSLSDLKLRSPKTII